MDAVVRSEGSTQVNTKLFSRDAKKSTTESKEKKKRGHQVV